MANISKLELLQAFGFPRDPFKHFTMKSNDHERIGKVVTMAVKDKAMVSVVGERGIGKSNAVRCALGKMKTIRLVYTHSNDINKLLIGDIEQALILDLSSEKPKRGREIRARQLRRILGEASTRMDVVLVIEEAHCLHGMTLRSLKRIREMEWMGKSELFSVLLICQSDPMNKPGVSEVRLRSDSIQMKGLSQDEISIYISRAVGSTFDQKAIEAICKRPDSHNYEDLKGMLFQLMEKALFAGRRKVIIEDVVSVFGYENLEDMRKKAGLSKADIAKKTGISPRDVSKILKGEGVNNQNPSVNSLRDFLDQYQNDDTGESQQVANG